MRNPGTNGPGQCAQDVNEMTQESQNIKVGSRVCVLGNAKSTCWKTGIIEDINADGALINHGSRNYPVYGKGIRVPLTGLEIMEA